MVEGWLGWSATRGVVLIRRCTKYSRQIETGRKWAYDLKAGNRRKVA